MRLFGKGDKSKETAAAKNLREFISQIQADEDSEHMWEEMTTEYLTLWITSPYRQRVQANAQIQELEYRWWKLKRREHQYLLNAISKRDPTLPRTEDPNILRTISSLITTHQIISNPADVSWANDWRFYYQNLQGIELKPIFDVPPSFTGKFPNWYKDE